MKPSRTWLVSRKQTEAPRTQMKSGRANCQGNVHSPSKLIEEKVPRDGTNAHRRLHPGYMCLCVPSDVEILFKLTGKFTNAHSVVEG